MLILLAGLLILLGVHSVRIFAEDWRTRTIDGIGLLKWKAAYGLVSLVGFALVVIGFPAARAGAVALWQPPAAMALLTMLLTIPAFILVVAGYVPGSHLKKMFGHPMVFGVALWGLAHLLANGRSVDLLLFGAFLVWATADFLAARRRDGQAGIVRPAGNGIMDVIVVVVGVFAWAAVVFVIHEQVLGVKLGFAG